MITENPPLQTQPGKGALSSTNLECPSGLTASRADLTEQSRKLQQLVQQTEELRDPVARALVHECLRALLTFYGNGLARALQVVQGSGPNGRQVFDRLVNDPVVRALLIIHGLHPLDLPARLRQALDQVRPYLQSHGGDVELLGLNNEIAKLRLQGTCKGCPSSTVTMELALRRAIEEACPDLVGFEVEGLEPSANGNQHVLSNPREGA